MSGTTKAVDVPDSPLVCQRKQQAIEALQALSENDLKGRIIIPLFDKLGMKCASVDRRHEGQHRCDVLMEYEVRGEARIEGAQLKANANIHSKDYVREEIERASIVALNFNHPLTDRSTLTRLSRYYWITTGSIDRIGAIGIKEVLGAETQYFPRVDVWGVDRLVAEIQTAAPELLPPLELLQIEQDTAMYRQGRQGVFAAHCCYKAFLWHHRQPKMEFDGAAQYLEEALRCLDLEDRKSIYYSRVLRKYYEGLLLLLREARQGKVPWWPGQSLREVLSSAEAISALESPEDEHPRSHGLAWLVRDVESIHRQLGIMLDRFLTIPAPLIPVQIGRLLLRFGYPPSEPALAECLRATERQLGEEDQRSIHSKCSLCTATAVSCFSLAGDSERLKVKPAVDWLETLKPYRYCYIEAETFGLPGESYSQHALHYAATVLTAYLDWGAEECHIENVREVFFKSEKVDSQGFFCLEWMRYRNEDRFEICRYIFSAFLRYILVRGELPKREEDEEDLVRKALESFVAAIYAEAKDTQDPVRFYASRTNLGSLALGMILGVTEAVGLARRVAGVLHRRGVRTDALWTGSVERTLSFLEGFLDYWEAVLFLEQKGGDVRHLLPETDGMESSASTGEKA
jgi:hypothetical protein